MDFGKKFKKAMIEAGISQQQLAEKLGIKKHQQISKWATGKSVPRPETIRKIAEALGVPVSYFLGEDNSVNQQINGNSVNISQNLNQKNASESNFEAEIKKELQMINLKLDLLLERSKDKKG